MKINTDMFLFDIDHFLCDVMGPRYLHLKKVYFFVGHPVVEEDWQFQLTVTIYFLSYNFLAIKQS